MSKRRLEDSEDENITDHTLDSSFLEDIEASSVDIEDFTPAQDDYDDMIPTQQHIEVTIPPLMTSTAFQAKVIDTLAEYFSKTEKYVKAIKKMCSLNLESIEVEYEDLKSFHESLENSAEEFLSVLDAALVRVTQGYFPNYHLIKPLIHGRIINLPVIENIRDLRNSHLNKLVRINGVVTRRSGVYSLYSIVKFTCTKCKATFGPFIGKNIKPTSCFECQGKGPFVVNTSETVYKDFQKLTIQEIPGTVPSGSLPRSKEVLLYFDLIDCCKPGDEVDIVGIYQNNFSISLNIKNGFPVFSTMIEASSIRKKVTKLEMTDDDIREIKELGKNPNIIDLLIDNIAPSIYGHKDIKTAILLSMVGGQAKEKNGIRIRGDINVLLMGDPGTAKSQFLRYVSKTSHRAVMSTGQGSSAVGLTASVQKDPVTHEWTLEGGALVLADRGVCLIDEFDKMNDTDRTSIHEAMEQQSISISKAGIVATLHARCAVIAAANPVRGKYNPALSFAQNINLSDPIVSRFDLLCVVKDTIDKIEDTRMAEFILHSHSEQKSPATHRGKISQDLLRKYLLYVRNHIEPVLSTVDVQKISHLYADLRKESVSSGIPITVRHIEAIVRVSEAFAKLRLSNTVAKVDIDRAISLTLDSFLNSQRYSLSKQLKKKFSKYFEENSDDLMVFILKQMISERLAAAGLDNVPVSEFTSRCLHNGLTVGDRFFNGSRFSDEGFVIKGDKICRN
ncbi:MCM DNA helicase complex subunit [Glugoides intestinalis]